MIAQAQLITTGYCSATSQATQLVGQDDCTKRHGAFTSHKNGQASDASAGSLTIQILKQGTLDAAKSAAATASIVRVGVGSYVYSYDANLSTDKPGSAYQEFIRWADASFGGAEVVQADVWTKPGLCESELHRIATWVNMLDLCEAEKNWAAWGKQRVVSSLAAMVSFVVGRKTMLKNPATGRTHRIIASLCCDGPNYGEIELATTDGAVHQVRALQPQPCQCGCGTAGSASCCNCGRSITH